MFTVCLLLSPTYSSLLHVVSLFELFSTCTSLCLVSVSHHSSALFSLWLLFLVFLPLASFFLFCLDYWPFSSVTLHVICLSYTLTLTCTFSTATKRLVVVTLAPKLVFLRSPHSFSLHPPAFFFFFSILFLSQTHKKAALGTFEM